MPSEPIVVTVRFDVGRLSPNRTRWMHPLALSRLVKQAKIAARLAWCESDSPMLDVPATVNVTIRRGRKLDGDACLYSCKALTDILFCRDRNKRKLGHDIGVTPDDSERWVRWGEVRQESGKRWIGAEEVEFVIMPRE
jgi:hypothetical protein